MKPTKVLNATRDLLQRGFAISHGRDALASWFFAAMAQLMKYKGFDTLEYYIIFRGLSLRNPAPALQPKVYRFGNPARHVVGYNLYLKQPKKTLKKVVEDMVRGNPEYLPESSGPKMHLELVEEDVFDGQPALHVKMMHILPELEEAFFRERHKLAGQVPEEKI